MSAEKFINNTHSRLEADNDNGSESNDQYTFDFSEEERPAQIPNKSAEQDYLIKKGEWIPRVSTNEYKEDEETFLLTTFRGLGNFAKQEGVLEEYVSIVASGAEPESYPQLVDEFDISAEKKNELLEILESFAQFSDDDRDNLAMNVVPNKTEIIDRYRHLPESMDS